MRRFAVLVVVAVVASCKREEVGTVVGPGLTVEIPEGGSTTTTTTTSDAGKEAPFGPVTAEFVELGAAGFHTEHVACEQRIVHVVGAVERVPVDLDIAQTGGLRIFLDQLVAVHDAELHVTHAGLLGEPDLGHFRARNTAGGA